MKPINFNTIKRISSIVLVATLTVGIMQSCAKKVSFQNSSVVPAAEGGVKVKKDNNNNYKIDLNLKRLADPKRLSPAREVYVVWMDTERNGTKNLGQLKTSSGMFSSSLKSSLETTTPFKPVRIYITAEDDADITYASGQRVMETSNF